MMDGTGSGNPMAAFMEKLQQAQGQMKQMESQMPNVTASGESGGGMVTVEANGRMEILSVKIKPAAIDPEDPEMLEDLVLSACNQALSSVQQLVSQRMSGLTSGLGLSLP